MLSNIDFTKKPLVINSNSSKNNLKQDLMLLNGLICHLVEEIDLLKSQLEYRTQELNEIFKVDVKYTELKNRYRKSKLQYSQELLDMHNEIIELNKALIKKDEEMETQIENFKEELSKYNSLVINYQTEVKTLQHIKSSYVDENEYKNQLSKNGQLKKEVEEVRKKLKNRDQTIEELNTKFKDLIKLPSSTMVPGSVNQIELCYDWKSSWVSFALIVFLGLVFGHFFNEILKY
ncbi:hypothetical protein DLAC_04430 [Tieghemostelium lacteum]|uniref:Uncharacterized protein n=1 Tax=Tieghemostelium lacteum TaxID=361077 RepID=A0A151ZK04_TIELA|nr:hypothetical protein DLAC_04430 [Tieghemostelium lacteum]|eukprot:KYQ94144.1 hypothetical protein DLAC_04430 [Tieghemostelium lacteum]